MAKAWLQVVKSYSSQVLIVAGLATGTAPTASAFEISFGKTQSIDDQGRYAYCTYYALANFFELWANQQHDVLTPPVSHGFLTMENNYEWGSGQGQRLEWAWIAAAKHGVIPSGSKLVETGSVWPSSTWQEDQLTLQSSSGLADKLSARYQHANITGSFDGREYLESVVKINMDDFRFVTSNHHEDYVPHEPFPSTRVYRHGSYSLATQAVSDYDFYHDLETDQYAVDPDALYQAIKAQLYMKRPVLVAVNTAITSKYFYRYKTLGKGDLVQEGKGKLALHAIVAIAHCDKWETTDPVCKPFAKEMATRNMPECIVYENSWGNQVHQSGHVCISRLASERVLADAVVKKELIEQGALLTSNLP